MTSLKVTSSCPSSSIFESDSEKSLRRKAKTFTPSMSSDVFFQVLCSGSSGFPASLLLHTDHKRLLFNCSEGTQRLLLEHSLSRSLSLLERVFLTRGDWKTLGGLAGLCLAVRGSGSPDIYIHGPFGASKFYGATKAFLRLSDFDVYENDDSKSIYRDQNVEIESFCISSDSNESSKSCQMLSEWRTTYVGSSNYENEFSPQDKPPSRASKNVWAYKITIYGTKGKLDMKKCLENNVPTGPLLGLLKEGKDVVLEDGRVIRSADVCSSSSKSSVYLIVDLPSKSYLKSFSSKMKSLTTENLNGVFHFTPSVVMKSHEYSQWMSSLNVLHHMVNDVNVGGYGSLGPTLFRSKLHALNSSLFPRLPNDIVQSLDKHEKETWKSHTIGDKIFVRGSIPDISSSLSFSHLSEAIDETRQKIPSSSSSSLETLSPPLSFPILSFLGTGSSVPSKYRGPSGILLQTSKDSYMLFDSGEGTLVQLIRQFGLSDALDILSKIKVIFISHLHADHHLGLPGLLLQRVKNTCEPIYIAAPAKYAQFLLEYHNSYEDILGKAIQIRNEHLLYTFDSETRPEEHFDTFLSYIGAKAFATSRAFHGPDSFSVSVVLASGFHFVYSGDTRPNSGLIELTRKYSSSPDLVIHEATMEQKLLGDAIKKKHSTFTEAIQFGRAVNAQNIILTHFSQRYTKFPLFFEIENEPNVGFAFDHMMTNSSNFSDSQKLIPALKNIFSNDYELLLARSELLVRKEESYYNPSNSNFKGQKTPVHPNKKLRTNS